MPALSLRRIGSSHLIEGFHQAGLEPSSLLDQLSLTLGEAVAPIAEGDETPRQPTGILVDVRALSWEDLQAALLDWVQAQGASELRWSSAGSYQARLEFGLQP